MHSSGGVWTRVGASPCVALGYSTGYAAVPPTWPIYAAADVNVLTANLNRRGIRLIPPVPMTAQGIWAWGRIQQGSGIFELYDDGSTVLASFAWSSGAGSGNDYRAHFGLFTTSVTLSRGSTYRVIMRATGTGALQLEEALLGDSTAAWPAMPAGTNALGTFSSVGGAWTNLSTDVPWIGVIVRGVDDGSSHSTGGGAVTNIFVVND